MDEVDITTLQEKRPASKRNWVLQDSPKRIASAVNDGDSTFTPVQPFSTVYSSRRPPSEPEDDESLGHKINGINALNERIRNILIGQNGRADAMSPPPTSDSPPEPLYNHIVSPEGGSEYEPSTSTLSEDLIETGSDHNIRTIKLPSSVRDTSSQRSSPDGHSTTGTRVVEESFRFIEAEVGCEEDDDRATPDMLGILLPNPRVRESSTERPNAPPVISALSTIPEESDYETDASSKLYVPFRILFGQLHLSEDVKDNFRQHAIKMRSVIRDIQHLKDAQWFVSTQHDASKRQQASHIVDGNSTPAFAATSNQRQDSSSDATDHSATKLARVSFNETQPSLFHNAQRERKYFSVTEQSILKTLYGLRPVHERREPTTLSQTLAANKQETTQATLQDELGRDGAAGDAVNRSPRAQDRSMGKTQTIVSERPTEVNHEAMESTSINDEDGYYAPLDVEPSSRMSSIRREYRYTFTNPIASDDEGGPISVSEMTYVQIHHTPHRHLSGKTPTGTYYARPARVDPAYHDAGTDPIASSVRSARSRGEETNLRLTPTSLENFGVYEPQDSQQYLQRYGSRSKPFSEQEELIRNKKFCTAIIVMIIILIVAAVGIGLTIYYD